MPRRPALSILSRALALAAVLANAAAASAAGAADYDLKCTARMVGKPTTMKVYRKAFGHCFDTDRGNDPYLFGRTRFQKQTIGWRDKAIRLPDGRPAIEEYYCHLPHGIMRQVFSCPCGIYARVKGRGACRIKPLK